MPLSALQKARNPPFWLEALSGVAFNCTAWSLTVPVFIVNKSAALAAPAPVPATTGTTPTAAPVAAPAAKPKPQGHCKPLPFDVADLHKPGRLRVGHLMALFAVSHSTFYKYQAAGLIPKPDGKEFKRPFWFTSTVLPYFTGTKGAAA